MKVFKFLAALAITLGLIYLLDTSHTVGGSQLPPLGRFLDPFHGFWQNIEARSCTVPESYALQGLQKPVSVAYDSLMIPHIFAGTSEDLYFMQGYVTASHRLWQMEIQTHAAAGRASEIVGELALDNDRATRRQGMVFGAENMLRGMMKNPQTRMMLEQYTAGINAYIESLNDRTLPLEYKLLNYKPEPWTPLKCALHIMNMARTLCVGDKDMEMSNTLKLYGKDVVNLLYPDNEGVADPIVDNAGHWNFKPATVDTFPYAIPDSLIQLKKMPPSDPTIGSNNWAVSGTRTATGAPILCGDPHLNLSLPSLWYTVQLHGPGINVMGASFPGLPAVVIGFNDSVAWSPTNAQRDLVDWYAITFENARRDKYLLDGAWVPTRKVVEEFTVRGKGVVYDTVVYTHWGPVMYDYNFHDENNHTQHAFRWIAHDESNQFLAFHKLNLARNYADYMAALNEYDAPAQNFAFASAAGDIAIRVQGKYPVRRTNEGKFILDGSKSSNGWAAYIPDEQNVTQKNPARGFVSSANQYPADATYPYYITGTHYEAYRNRRINTLLQQATHVTPDDMIRMQVDNYNLRAAESLPLFLQQLDSARFTQTEAVAFRILKQWNYVNDKDSQGASYFQAWWDNLMPLVWDELDKNHVLLTRPTRYTTVKLIREKPTLSFFDIQSTPEKETAKEVIQKSFALGVKDMEAWKAERPTAAQTSAGAVAPWSEYKDSFIGHLLRLPALSEHVLTGGNYDIINAHSKTSGPSWRMVVSLEKSGVKAWGLYPGGQSGNPGSAHYIDMLDRWVHGKSYPLLFFHSSEEAATQKLSRTQFNPESK